MSCPKKEVELILWCRNWVAVYKREKFLSDWTYDSSSDEYSDWLWSLWRTPWECQAAISQKDPEIVCMTNDWGETVIKWVVIFSYDWTNWTSTVNNLDGTVATWYTVIPCTTNQWVEEGEARCDAWNTIIPFYDVETDGVASATIAFWFNPLTNSVVVPSGTQTLWACIIATPDRQVDVLVDCAGTVVPTDVLWTTAQEVILWGTTQAIDVRIKEDCSVPVVRDVVIDTDCLWTDETVQVEWANPIEVIIHPTQALKVVIDESCAVADRQVDVLEDCLWTTTPTNVDGEVAQEVILSGSTKTIPVRIVEDCKLPITADVPNCAWTTDPKPVDEITATYLLNQENKHTERLYDNVTATLTGTIGLLITGTDVAIDFSWIVATNRVWANYILEAGTWFSDVGWNPTRDYINEPDGNYEVKIYRTFVYPEGRRDYLISAIEVIKTGSTLTVQWTNPVALNRSITYTTKEVLQDYCNNLPVWVPYLTDGTAATIIWTLSLSYREEQTERLWISDANNNEAQVSIERLDMVDFIDPTNAVHFTRIVERTNWVVTATYDIDNTGAIYTPTGVVLSKEKDQEYKSTCYRALVNWAWFTAGDVLEFNVVFDPRNPLTPHYINRTNRNTLWNVFDQSPAGISGTFPTVGIEVIPCEQYVECKKETIAVEPKFYVTEVPSAPAGYTWFDFDLPTDYWTTDATDTYFHILSLSTQYYYPPAVTNPTTPILIDGNVTAINNFIQASLIADGQVWDEFYIVVNADKTITVRAKNTYTPTGNELRLWQSTPDQYTNKYYPVIPTTHLTTTTTCIDIQEVKEKDTCTGLETYRYVIEDGVWNLVDASTFIAGRDEANVSSSCPETPVTPIVEIPWWALVPTGNTFNSFPANVVSFTVSAQSGSFDISFDSWTTFLTARKGTRTRWQGTIETIDVSQVVVVSNWDVDIIRETI